MLVGSFGALFLTFLLVIQTKITLVFNILSGLGFVPLVMKVSRLGKPCYIQVYWQLCRVATSQKNRALNFAELPHPRRTEPPTLQSCHILEEQSPQLCRVATSQQNRGLNFAELPHPSRTEPSTLQSCHIPAEQSPQLCRVLPHHLNCCVPAKVPNLEFVVQIFSIWQENQRFIPNPPLVIQLSYRGNVRVVQGQPEVTLLIAVLIPVWPACVSVRVDTGHCQLQDMNAAGCHGSV
jgi:hypothetical protein